jgi:DNA-binding LacI/PurR family transcriptional regulator
MIVPQFLTDYPFLGLLQARAFPYVMFRPARFGSDVNFVDIENATGGRIVADLLIKLGHRRIAMINGPKTHVDAMERERGFLERLAGAGIYDVVKRYGDFLIKSGFNAMNEILIDERPDAVFCANDYMAAGAIKLLSESGFRVPHDVTVIGYDNNDICLGTVPSLTTVDHRLEELGQCLGKGLLDLIERRSTEVRKSILPRLVERQSHSTRPMETRIHGRSRAGSD